MNNYTIYMHKNKTNGKIYIGQTCQKPEYRWNNGKGYIQCTAFYRAIEKYGWDGFEHLILFENLSQEEANLKEQELINQYQSNNKDFGYNIQTGGENHTFSKEGKEHCRQNALRMWKDEQHKQNISEKMKEKWKDSEYIEKQSKAQELARQKHFEETGSRCFMTEEGKKRISEARKQYIAMYGTPTQGVGHTEETKEKIRQSKLGEKNPMYGKHHTEEQKRKVAEKLGQKVRCVETGDIFISLKEAAKWAGLKSSTGISACLSGTRKTSGTHPITKEKLHWERVKE